MLCKITRLILRPKGLFPEERLIVTGIHSLEFIRIRDELSETYGMQKINIINVKRLFTMESSTLLTSMRGRGAEISK